MPFAPGITLIGRKTAEPGSVEKKTTGYIQKTDRRASEGLILLPYGERESQEKNHRGKGYEGGLLKTWAEKK